MLLAEFQHSCLGYKTLVPWWAKVAKTMDRHFYSSMRISTMPQNSPQRMKSVLRRLGMSENEYNGLSMVERSIAATAAKGTEECGFEVDMNRSTDLMGAPGHVFSIRRSFSVTGWILMSPRINLPNRR